MGDVDVYEELAEAVAAATALQWERLEQLSAEDEAREEYEATKYPPPLSFPHNHGNRNWWRPASYP